MINTSTNPHRFSIAPMMDWTDRHCRAFHRVLSPNAMLYTEMVTTGALIHGDVARHLDFDASEHPVVLQLGGSEPADLAHCAKLAEQWGYDEININCGCPSERVQRGSFGACLMHEPNLVADCVKAMCDATPLPVTVKHRIGIDKTEDSPQAYSFVRDFIGAVSEAGCKHFIVHARNAWLKGLNPKENREVPPLRYAIVHQLKRDFPHLTISINGGIKSTDVMTEQLALVDGVMIGREAYQNPWSIVAFDQTAFFTKHNPIEDGVEVRETYARRMMPYIAAQHKNGVPVRSIVRHMLGLFNGLPGAKRWRQVLSEPRYLKDCNETIIETALALMPQPKWRDEDERMEQAWVD
jgi:tRNA-dihydrouridine synthase A